MSGPERPSRRVNCAIRTASRQKIARLYLAILNHVMEVERIACHGDHRARRRIKIHSVEAVFPEDIPDVLAVAIEWISHSPADDDSNEKT
jgi:hypothetical protein